MSCYCSLSYPGVLGALIFAFAAGIVILVRRAGNKRSKTVSILRIFVNYAQANASMGSFSTKAPALIRSMFDVSTVADGMSLNSVLVQCALKLPYYGQVAPHCVFLSNSSTQPCNPLAQITLCCCALE